MTLPSQSSPCRAAGTVLAATLGMMACASSPAWAESRLAHLSPSGDVSLDLQPALRMYWRAGYTRVKPNDRSSDAQDLNGNILRYGDQSTPGLDAGNQWALNRLDVNMTADHPNDAASQGLGIPRGATVKSGGGVGLTLSIGRYLDDNRKWAVEAYVLGQPFETSVQGAGRIGGQGEDSVDLGEVIRTKLLGPIAFGKYIFGDKSDRLRFSMGLGAAYIVFFDTNASESLSRYSGGPTTARIKNTFGPGGFLGADWRFNEPWSLSLTVGYLKLRTESTVSTQTDPNVVGVSPALLQSARDVGSNTLTTMELISGARTGSPNLVPGIGQQLAVARTGQANNLGTYQRKISTRLDPWLLSLSVGRDF